MATGYGDSGSTVDCRRLGITPFTPTLTLTLTQLEPVPVDGCERLECDDGHVHKKAGRPRK